MTLDVVVDGALMNSLQDVAYNLIDDMANQHHSWGYVRERSVKSPKKGRLYEVSQLDHMNVKVDALYQKLENLTVSQSASTLVVIVTPATPARPFYEVCMTNRHCVGEHHMVQER